MIASGEMITIIEPCGSKPSLFRSVNLCGFSLHALTWANV